MKSVIQTIYDITKGHGGELPIIIGTIGIKVETKEGEGTEFTFQLNINTTS